MWIDLLYLSTITANAYRYLSFVPQIPSDCLESADKRGLLSSEFDLLILLQSSAHFFTIVISSNTRTLHFGTPCMAYQTTCLFARGINIEHVYHALLQWTSAYSIRQDRTCSARNTSHERIALKMSPIDLKSSHRHCTILLSHVEARCNIHVYTVSLSLRIRIYMQSVCDLCRNPVLLSIVQILLLKIRRDNSNLSDKIGKRHS